MKKKVLVSAPYMQPVVGQFLPLLEQHEIEIVLPPVAERMEEEDLLACIADADGVICGDDRFTEKVLRSAKKLKVISKWGTGIDSIDVEACHRLGIVVRNTPNAFTDPVADSVMGFILCFARNLFSLNTAMHQGQWRKVPGRALRECTLGVIGVGNVGKAVVRRARGFGMRVVGNDIKHIDPGWVTEIGIAMITKEELLESADFVSLNCDLNPSSFHLMNEKSFSLMKESAVLVNTARGPIVDETILIRFLQEGRIAGAALDVFENEPLPGDSPLRFMENVLMSPHNTNSSPEAWGKVHTNTIRNLIEILEPGKH